MTTKEEYAKKFHEIFERSRHSKFDHEYSIDTCEVPSHPDTCLVFQLDKEKNKMSMSLIGSPGAEVFSVLSPLDERVVKQYKKTKEFEKARKLYIK